MKHLLFPLEKAKCKYSVPRSPARLQEQLQEGDEREWYGLVFLQLLHNFLMLPILYHTGYKIIEHHQFIQSTGVIPATSLEDSADYHVR